MRRIDIIRLELELELDHRLFADSGARCLRRHDFVHLPAVARSHLFLRYQCDFHLRLEIKLEVGAAHINWYRQLSLLRCHFLNPNRTLQLSSFARFIFSLCSRNSHKTIFWAWFFEMVAAPLLCSTVAEWGVGFHQLAPLSAPFLSFLQSCANCMAFFKSLWRGCKSAFHWMTACRIWSCLLACCSSRQFSMLLFLFWNPASRHIALRYEAYGRSLGWQLLKWKIFPQAAPRRSQLSSCSRSVFR